MWSEQFDILNMNGSPQLPIRIGNYGAGSLPVVDGGQTSSVHGRSYCIDGINTNFSWITVDGIECRNAYKQGITFQAYHGAATIGVGIVVQNSYVHHDGPGACTTCGPRPEPDRGGYLNQLDAQYSTGVQYLNNTLEHLGGHNALNVHYDRGKAIISGNRINVGSTNPWYNHNGIDVKGGKGTVNNNIVTCPGCGGAAFYTENTEDPSETISFVGNVAYENWNAFMIDSGGACAVGRCSISAKLFNNTIYNSQGQTNIIDLTCINHSLEIQRNIIDGGDTRIVKGPGCKVIWDYNVDGGVHSISGNPVGAHDLTRFDPKYADSLHGDFRPHAILPSSVSGSAPLHSYIGAFPSLTR
jgi:hypothetical protein